MCSRELDLFCLELSPACVVAWTPKLIIYFGSMHKSLYVGRLCFHKGLIP